MDTKHVFKTLGLLGYGVALITDTLPKPETQAYQSPVTVSAEALETQISQLTLQVKHQNNAWNRFVIGVTTGVGTALGASVVAGLIALILGPILKALGIDINLPDGN